MSRTEQVKTTSAELPNTSYGRAFQTGKLEGRIAQGRPEIVEITRQ